MEPMPPQTRLASVKRFLNRTFRHRDDLDIGMEKLNQLMGMSEVRQAKPVAKELWKKVDTHRLARTIFYAPDMDGQADPGEVVWADIHTVKGGEIARRSLLIVGRRHHTLLTLLISSNAEHADQDNWFKIGTGPWDSKGRESWIRIDKILELPESLIQRRGVSMPERRFERIASRLRDDYGWS